MYFGLKTCFAVLLPLFPSCPQRVAPSSTQKETWSGSSLSTVRSYKEPLLKVNNASDSTHLYCCALLFDVKIICASYVNFNWRVEDLWDWRCSWMYCWHFVRWWRHIWCTFCDCPNVCVQLCTHSHLLEVFSVFSKFSWGMHISLVWSFLILEVIKSPFVISHLTQTVYLASRIAVPLVKQIVAQIY
jgi:hypothetical protein